MKRVLFAIAVMAATATTVLAATPDGKEGKECCKAKTECCKEKKCDKECKEVCTKGDKKACDTKATCSKDKKECPKKK